MSDYIYRVRYDRSPLAASAESRIDLQTQIGELLRILGAAPLPSRLQATSLEKIEAKAIDPTIRGSITLPEGMIEVPVPEDLTGPAVQNETLLLTAINENELLVTVTDASLQTIQCDRIVRDIAIKLYEKGTGRKVAPEEVEVQKVGILTFSICQHCRNSIHGLPHRCSHCGRTFCRSHATPSEHQCAIAPTITEAGMGQAMTRRSRSEAKLGAKSQPKVRVGKVPCG